jgi:hypothetical protein
MREIATVLGKLDDVVDTEIPKDLVRFLPLEPDHRLTAFFAAYNLHGEVQRRFPFPGRLSSSANDGRPRRMAFQEGY